MCSAVEQAFRDGSGIHPERYPAGVWEAMERLSGAAYENLLVGNWVAALPDLEAKLKQGALVADVGCGAARALIKLAQAFPSSRFVGFDMTNAFDNCAKSWKEPNAGTPRPAAPVVAPSSNSSLKSWLEESAWAAETAWRRARSKAHG